MTLETQLAEGVLRSIQQGHPPVHRFREADGSCFPHVSRRFYRTTAAALESLGFEFLGDIEDVTSRETGKPDPRTFLRIMVDTERTTIATFCHIAPPLLWRLAMVLVRIPSTIVEFESVAVDGTFQTTSNSPNTRTPRPDTVRLDCAPRSLSHADLHARHRENLKGLNAPFRRIETIADVIAFQVEQHARVRAHLEAVGWVTREYLLTQGVRKSHVDEVYAEAQRLVAEGFDQS